MAAAAGAGKFPPSMCAYVQRVFAQQVSPQQKAAMQAELKGIIEDANVKGEMWTKNWDIAPLPASCTAGSSAPGSRASPASAREAASAAAAAISAKVAQDSRWGVAGRGAGKWSTASSGSSGSTREAKVMLPDWRPNNEWKKNSPNKRQKKVRIYSF